MKELTISLNDPNMTEDDIDDYVSKLRKINQAIFFFEWCQHKHPDVVKEYLARYKDE